MQFKEPDNLDSLLNFYFFNSRLTIIPKQNG